MKNFIVVSITVLVAVLRLLIEPRLTNIPSFEGSYEAFSHMFVGGLFGAWLVCREKKLWLWLAITISLEELILFNLQKFGVL